MAPGLPEVLLRAVWLIPDRWAGSLWNEPVKQGWIINIYQEPHEKAELCKEEPTFYQWKTLLVLVIRRINSGNIYTSLFFSQRMFVELHH